MAKILIPTCSTCGNEEEKDVPSRKVLEEELEQLQFQEQNLLRLLDKCRKKIGERKRTLALLP